MNKPTRYYSNKQEKRIAKKIGGRQTANSGATKFSKGDISAGNWLIEAKTKTKESTSFTIKKEWLDKNKEEAFAMNKDYSALAFDFGDDGEIYYVIDEKLFIALKNYLENDK
jgi:hypothetical protein